MQRKLIGSLVLVAAFGFSLPVEAAGFRGITRIKHRSWWSKTIETTVIRAEGTTTSLDVAAVYTTSTVTTQILWCRKTSTQSTFTASLTILASDASDFEGGEADFQVVEGTSPILFVSSTVSGGQASVSLSTAQGDDVPVVSQGDFFSPIVRVPDGSRGYATSVPFGDPQTTTTTSGG